MLLRRRCIVPFRTSAGAEAWVWQYMGCTSAIFAVWRRHRASGAPAQLLQPLDAAVQRLSGACHSSVMMPCPGSSDPNIKTPF